MRELCRFVAFCGIPRGRLWLNNLAALLMTWAALCVGVMPAQAAGTGALQGPGARVALVIGNAAYQDLPLRNPVNDAVDLSARLRGMGFDVTILTDRSRSEMTRAIRDFGLRAAGAEAAVFYFAGHGVQIRGRNYLLPVGQRFTTEAEVETDAVDVGAVLARIEEGGPRVSVLILDACRTNPLQRAGRSTGRGLAPQVRQLAQVNI